MRVSGFIVSFAIVLSSSAWAEDASVHAFHDSFFKAWNTANADGLVARLAEDTVYHPMGGVRRCTDAKPSETVIEGS